MISKTKIESLIAEKLSEGNYFVVSLDVSTANKIKLVVDHFDGITIEQCVAFSRQIEHNIDREEEDFELVVTSPGLSTPLLVKQQYEKNVGRELDILLTNDTRIKGELLTVEEEQLVVHEEKKMRVEGKKNKQLVKQDHTIKISDIKSALVVIKF